MHKQKDIALTVALVVVMGIGFVVGRNFGRNTFPHSLTRTVVPPPRVLAENNESNASKNATVLDAQHIAIAILSYGQDYDGGLPPPHANVEKLLLENKEALVQPADFAAIPGTTIKQNEKAFQYAGEKGGLFPSYTAGIEGGRHGKEIGFKRGPGGRAVIYADGFVSWQSTTNTSNTSQ
ncbi:MAG: hypothetical protein EOP06_08510 [Proteobacteria bacterium]|nr:MAG: hypothetical protein EOP06_08510 [Pseudomonadota bacterium]